MAASSKNYSNINELRSRLSNDLKNLEQDASKLKNCLNTLSEFYKISITRDVLVESKIGVFVGNLRKHQSQDIQKASIELVNHWRNAIQKTAPPPITSENSNGNTHTNSTTTTNVPLINPASTNSSDSIRIDTKNSSDYIQTNDKSYKQDNKQHESIKVPPTLHLNGSSGDKSTLVGKEILLNIPTKAEITQKSSPNSSNSGSDCPLKECNLQSDYISKSGIVDVDKREISKTVKISDNNNYEQKSLSQSLSNNYRGRLTSIAIRDRARQFLYKGFIEGLDSASSKGIDEGTLTNVIELLEEALWKAKVVGNKSTSINQHSIPNNTKDYSLQVKTIKWNLSDLANVEFNLDIYRGELSPEEVATMESKDMASNAKKLERKRQFQEGLEACQSDWERRNVQVKDGQFTCFRCYGKKTTYHQVQIRSADEPMTTFVTCISCNNRWKF